MVNFIKNRKHTAYHKKQELSALVNVSNWLIYEDMKQNPHLYKKSP
jgi:hypothetical protein